MRLPSGTERDLALALWALNFATIAGWAKLFFGDRDLDGSLADLAMGLAAALGFVAAASRVDGPAAALGVPYAAWTAFGGGLERRSGGQPRAHGSSPTLTTSSRAPISARSAARPSRTHVQ